MVDIKSIDELTQIAAGDSGKKDSRGNPLASTDIDKQKALIELEGILGSKKARAAVRNRRNEFVKEYRNNK